MKKSIVSMVIVWAVLAASANQAVTVLAQAGARQTYGGFGASTEIFWTNGDSYNSLPAAKRQAIAQTFWGETGFNLLRLWVHTYWTAGYIDSTYGVYIRDALRANPDLTVFFGPMSAQESNWGDLAQLIRELKDEYDITIGATGITNEPNVSGKGSPTWVASAVKQLRQELDSRDLNDVIIIAPEVSNVDSYGISYLDAILADAGSLEALGAFSTHSYNMCITKQVADKVWPAMSSKGKQYWVTESAAGDGWENSDDSFLASGCAARCLSDLNLCATHWTYFISYHPCAYDTFAPNDSGNRKHEMMCYSPTGDTEFLLKFFYYKQISRAFRPGCEMRLSHIPEFGGNDSWMVNTYGQKPPLCAAVGKNEDGTWALAAANGTYPTSTWSGSVPHKPETYDVTFHVEDLATAGDMEFVVLRSNSSVRLDDEGVKTMHNGEITVTVAMSELVTLRTEGGWTHAPPAGGRNLNAAPGVRCIVSSGLVRVSFDLGGCGGMAELAVHDLAGARVKTLYSAGAGAGRRQVVWNGETSGGLAASPGAYVLRISAGSTTTAVPFILWR